MNAWGLYGHDWAVDHLRRSMHHRRIRHAYLFTGTQQIGKTALAIKFAAALNCQNQPVDDEGGALDPRPCGVCVSCRKIESGSHPDVIWAQPDSTTGALKVEELRAVARQLTLMPFEARYRIAVFPHFDRAQPRAQDTLLKTLEEPAPRALLLLITDDPDAVLPTIHSRSQVIRLRTVSIDTVRAALREHGASADHADLLARLSAGRMGWALNALHQPDALDQRASAFALLDQVLERKRAGRFQIADDLAKDKPSLIPLLELWLSFWRDLTLMAHDDALPIVNIDCADRLHALRAHVNAERALTALKATQTLLGLMSTNVNTKLALSVMLLDYPGI